MLLKSKFSRRTFLKAAALTGAGLSLLGPTVAKPTLARGEKAADKVEWVPNICTMCVNTCGIKVKVKTTGNVTRAVKIEGNPEHPYSRGKICARGQSGLRRIYDPDRITRPMVRVEGSKRGEWKFKAVSWNDAIQYVGKRIQEEKIQPYEMGASGGWISCAFYRPYLLSFAFSMGIPNILATPMQHCVMAEHFGIDTALGTFNVHDEIVADYDNAKYIIAIAANAAVTGIATGRAVRFAEGRRKGNKVVVLDPRLSEFAAKADEWLPVKPGSDIAFALALLNSIIKNEHYDEEFIKAHTNVPFLTFEDKGLVQLAMEQDAGGKPAKFFVWDELSRSVKAVKGLSNTNLVDVDGKRIIPVLAAPEGTTWNGKPVKTVWSHMVKAAEPYTPEWAAAITDIPAATIRRIAWEFGTTRPAMMEPGWHGGRYESEVQMRRISTLIQALVGGIDKPGGWIFIGGMHELMHNFLEFYDPKNAEKNKGKMLPPTQVPGLMSPQGMLSIFFQNPNFWPHKHPSINQAWNEHQVAAGKDPVAFALFTDAGFKEANEGKLSYKGEPYKLRAFFNSQTNLVRQFYSSDDYKAMFTNPDTKLVVSIEISQSDSLPYSDVILPDQAYLEKYDPVFEVGMAHDLALQTRIPSIPAPGETKHTIDMFVEMASAFHADYAAWFAKVYGFDADMVRTRFKGSKSAVEAIQQIQVEASAKSLGMSPDKFMSVAKEKGIVPVESREEILEKWAMPRKMPLPTPSGRVEFYSLVLGGINQKYGYKPNWDPIFAWVPPQWKDGMKPEAKLTADDEFFFAYGKVPTQSHAATANNDLLMALSERKGAYMGIWIHPSRAKKLGIYNNDKISLTNQVSGQKVTGNAFVTEMIRPDTVFIAAAFGYENPLLKNAVGKGTALNSLVPHRLEPVVGGFKTSEFTVKVAKA